MEKILVYGMGQFWENYKNELCLKYNIVGFIDKKNTCIGENVYSSIKETMNIQYEKIIIMVSRVKVIFEIIKLLLDEGIAGNNIVLGINEFGDYAGKIQIYVDDRGRIVVEKDDIVIATWTEDEFANTIDTVLNECYKYYIPSGKKQIVFDVGMNIGDTAIYFANRPEVIAVYGFEPFKKTYIKALINIEKQKKVCTITPLNYGLSDKDAEIDIPYSSEMTCGQSTILSNTTKARKTYENRDLLQEKNFKCEKIVNKKSSNNYLSSLSVTNAEIKPQFDKMALEYNVTTTEDTVAIKCSAEHKKAYTSGCDKRIYLQDECVEHTVSVTSQTKQVRKYELKICKQAKDAPIIKEVKKSPTTFTSSSVKPI